MSAEPWESKLEDTSIQDTVPGFMQENQDSGHRGDLTVAVPKAVIPASRLAALHAQGEGGWIGEPLGMAPGVGGWEPGCGSVQGLGQGHRLGEVWGWGLNTGPGRHIHP